MQTFNPFMTALNHICMREKNADERVDSQHINHLEQSHNMLDELNINFNSYKDPFASCLQVVNSPKVLDFVSIEFVFKFTLKLSSSRLLTLPLKDMQTQWIRHKSLGSFSPHREDAIPIGANVITSY
jgi:hypothetical protein